MAYGLGQRKTREGKNSNAYVRRAQGKKSRERPVGASFVADVREAHCGRPMAWVGLQSRWGGL